VDAGGRWLQALVSRSLGHQGSGSVNHLSLPSGILSSRAAGRACNSAKPGKVKMKTLYQPEFLMESDSLVIEINAPPHPPSWPIMRLPSDCQSTNAFLYTSSAKAIN
jgi:hypothetical protein